MPGSLTYSPSGSEGGRSFGGGAELDKSLVGTTPLKRRNSSSAGNEDQHTPSGTAEKHDNIVAEGREPERDGVPPRSASRRSSQDGRQKVSTTGVRIPDRMEAQAAIKAQPPIEGTASFRQSTPSGVEEDVQDAVTLEHAHAVRKGKSGLPEGPPLPAEDVAPRESLIRNEANEGSEILPKHDSQERAQRMAHVAPSKQPVSYENAPHDGQISHGVVDRVEGNELDNEHGDQRSADNGDTADEHRSDLEVAGGKEAGGDSEAGGGTSCRTESDGGTRTGEYGGEPSDAVPSILRQEGLGVRHYSSESREGGAESAHQSVNHQDSCAQSTQERPQEMAEAELEQPRVLASKASTEVLGGRTGANTAHHQDDPGQQDLRFRWDVKGSVNEVGEDVEIPVQGFNSQREKVVTGNSRQSDAGANEAGLNANVTVEHGSTEGISSETGEERVLRPQTNQTSLGGGRGEKAHHPHEICSQREQGRSGQKPGGYDEDGALSLGRPTEDWGGREVPKPDDVGTRTEDHRHCSHSTDAYEHNGCSKGGADGATNARTDREEPQTPPSLARRSSQLRAVGPAMVQRNARGQDRNDDDSGVARIEMTTGHPSAEDSPSKIRGVAERPTAPQEPPPLTPRRNRSSSAAVRVLSPPHSPVAVAARVVCLEESVRSTACMKRAARAIALEDERRYSQTKPQQEKAQDRGVAHARIPSNEVRARIATSEGSTCDRREQEEDSQESNENERVRALRAREALQDAETERDRALELTLAVLSRRHVHTAEARVARVPRGVKRTHSPPRKSRRPRDHRSDLSTRVKDSAARTCGLSLAQVLLLRRSREVGRGGHGSTRLTEQRMDRLAEPKEDRPATRRRNPATESLVEELTRGMTVKQKRAFLHACFTDVRECTHKPHINVSGQRGPRRGGDGTRQDEVADEAKDEAGAKKAAFLYRMDAQERAQAAALKHRRGELVYKANLDKRVCPGCGAEQSYDEVQEKRKICPNCELEYRKPKTWAGVRKEFLARVEVFQESKRATLEAAAEHRERQDRMLARGIRDVSDGEIEGGESLFWEDIENDFIDRSVWVLLEEDAARRRAYLAYRSKAVHPACTFQPKLNPGSERVAGYSSWAGMTFLERVEGDLQRRREAMPAYLPEDHAHCSVIYDTF